MRVWIVWVEFGAGKYCNCSSSREITQLASGLHVPVAILPTDN
jgi:hypothetical protein